MVWLVLQILLSLLCLALWYLSCCVFGIVTSVESWLVSLSHVGTGGAAWDRLRCFLFLQYYCLLGLVILYDLYGITLITTAFAHTLPDRNGCTLTVAPFFNCGRSFAPLLYVAACFAFVVFSCCHVFLCTCGCNSSVVVGIKVLVLRLKRR